jgi:hypothetical protein
LSDSPIIVAAIIAALAGTLGLVVGREQKTAEIRQAWLVALRAECAALVAQVQLMAHVPQGGASAVDRRTESIVAFRISEAAIRLRLSRDFEESRSAIVFLDQLSERVARGDLASESLTPIAERFIQSIQKISKKEWRKIKSGGVASRVTLILLFICLIVFFWFSSRSSTKAQANAPSGAPPYSAPAAMA